MILHLARLVGDRVARAVQKLVAEALPLRIGELHRVKPLELSAHIGAQRIGGAQVGQVFIALLSQVGDEFRFQFRFRLVAARCLVQLRVFRVAVQHDEVLRFGDRCILRHSAKKRGLEKRASRSGRDFRSRKVQ